MYCLFVFCVLGVWCYCRFDCCLVVCLLCMSFLYITLYAGLVCCIGLFVVWLRGVVGICYSWFWCLVVDVLLFGWCCMVFLNWVCRVGFGIFSLLRVGLCFRCCLFVYLVVVFGFG